MLEFQDYAVSDSPNNDAFEAIVETYYQINGYITSAGKWFWVRDASKQQRGYQDIDVLAVGGSETVIVSVTSNLDDKLNTGKDGSVNAEKLGRLQQHFSRIYEYFRTVEQYRWMLEKPRKIRYVVAYNHSFQKTQGAICDALEKAGIDVLPSSDVLSVLRSHASKKNLKIQNQLLRAIQIIGKIHVSESND